MSKNFKIFLVVFLISMPFWWGINVFEKYTEEFFFISFLSDPQSSGLFLAQVIPIHIQSIKKEAPDIGARSAISVKIDKQGNQKIIFKKNPNQILPIASLTKLMTSYVVIDNYDFSQQLTISKKAIGQPENFGNLKVGESLSVENLMYIALIESSNDSAFALSELVTEKGFVKLMNLEAEHLGMLSTNFVDSTGYLPENHSTANDLVKLSQHIANVAPIIWEIASLPEFNLYTPDGVFHHQLSNTNELLGKYSEIIGGKTGYTEEAGGCLILVLTNPEDGSLLINVILGSEDRFKEMKKLIDYAQ